MQYIKYFFTISIIIGTARSCQSFAYDIMDFTTYQSQVRELKTAGKMLSKTQLIQELIALKDASCRREKESDLYYLADPICLLRKNLPDTDTLTMIDTMRPSIIDFGQTYAEDKQEFTYKGTQAIFQNTSTVFPKNNREKTVLIYLQKNGKTIRIPAEKLAFDASASYTFYTTKKDLTPLKKCTKQNYAVAFKSIDSIILQPGESLNLNKHLAYLGGYCKGNGRQTLMFYGGVCGFATQLFRTSLLIPDMQIVKRYPHSFWIVPYYSYYLYGDDAAIYELSRQFEIKNNDDQAIYFKTFTKNNYAYLVAIVPTMATKGVTITRHQVDTLQAEVIKEVFDISTDNIHDIQFFDAKYSKKEYSAR